MDGERLTIQLSALTEELQRFRSVLTGRGIEDPSLGDDRSGINRFRDSSLFRANDIEVASGTEIIRVTVPSNMRHRFRWLSVRQPTTGADDTFELQRLDADGAAWDVIARTKSDIENNQGATLVGLESSSYASGVLEYCSVAEFTFEQGETYRVVMATAAAVTFRVSKLIDILPAADQYLEKGFGWLSRATL